jgi:membrane protein
MEKRKDAVETENPRFKTEEAEERLSVAERRAREPGRGRQAGWPTEFPQRAWKDILWRVFLSSSEDRVMYTAGGVAFFALLAVFPGLATVVSLYGLFADSSTISQHVSVLAGILPPGVLELLADQMRRVAGQRPDTLGLAFVAGLLIALWSANSGMAALFDALNVVFKEKERRSLLRFYLTTFLFTLGGVAVLICAVAGVVVLPTMLAPIGLASSSELVISIGRWPLLLALIGIGLSLVYRYGPSRRDAKWRWVTWGSAVAALTWIAASMLFSVYVANFDSYNRTYGTLGAGVGFMVWMWLSIVIVLVGGELNAAMELQTARDTTSGEAKPIGRRGAVVADQVGAALSE